MPSDPNIFQQYLQAPKSIIDYQTQYNQADAAKNALAQSALAVQKGQMDLSNAADVNRQRNALRAAVTSGQLDLSNPAHAQQALAIAPDVAPAVLKTVQDSITSRALAAKDTAQAGHFGAQTDAENVNTRIAKANDAIKDIAAFNSPQDALASLQRHVAAGDVAPDKAQLIQSTMPTDPTQFRGWQLKMLQNIMAAKDQIALTTPDANAVLQAKTSTANNAATNATSRANNAANIGKDLQVAGIAPGGGVDENSERTAQAIANGQLPAPTGMALLNPRNQRILGRVMEINPQYDATTVSAKKAAATAFTSGQLGNALRSVSTANAHLDQLGELADALNNGNVQVVNKVQNYFSQQTGSPNVTNFDAIKNIVGQEVVKAIVAGGGGVQEREEAAKVFSSASSPAQLKGAIQHYRMVMGAQANNLMEQRRAAGLPDSTLPNYSTTNPSAPAAVPSGLPNGWTVKVN